MGIIDDVKQTDVKLMDLCELDAGFAMAIGLVPREAYIGGERFVEVQYASDADWTIFNSTGSWNDFGYAISRLGEGFVMNICRDPDKKQVSYYKVHAYSASVTTHSSDSDLKIATSMAAVSYAKWHGIIIN